MINLSQSVQHSELCCYSCAGEIKTEMIHEIRRSIFSSIRFRIALIVTFFSTEKLGSTKASLTNLTDKQLEPNELNQERIDESGANVKETFMDLRFNGCEMI